MVHLYYRDVNNKSHFYDPNIKVGQEDIDWAVERLAAVLEAGG